MPSLLTRFQAATDTFYDHLYFAGSVSAQAFRDGWAKGLRGPALKQFVKAQRANPPDSYKIKAVAEARTNTVIRKFRGRTVIALAAVLWLAAGGYWTVTNAVPVSATLAYFVIGLVAVAVISVVFQILFGLTNLLRGLVNAAYGWIAARVTGRERFNAFEEALEMAFTVLVAIAVFVLEVLATLLAAHWAFENFV